MRTTTIRTLDLEAALRLERPPALKAALRGTTTAGMRARAFWRGVYEPPPEVTSLSNGARAFASTRDAPAARTLRRDLGGNVADAVSAVAEFADVDEWCVSIALVQTLVHRCTDATDVLLRLARPPRDGGSPERGLVRGRVLPSDSPVALAQAVERFFATAAATADYAADVLAGLETRSLARAAPHGVTLGHGSAETLLARGADLVFGFPRPGAAEVVVRSTRAPRAGLERLVRLLATLAVAGAARPHGPVSDLALARPSVGRRTSRARATRPVPPVAEMFEGHAGRRPDADAVVCGARRLTFGELDRRANAQARALARAGVAPRSCVALVAQRGIDAVLGVLAVFKAGAAYVPLDLDQPDARSRFILGDADVAAVLADADQAARFRELAGPAVPVLTLGEGLDAVSQAHLDSNVGDNDLAYVIYTSGTTGVPKGVAVEHGAYARTCANYMEAYGLDSFDPVSLQLANLTFDVFNGDLGRSIFNGFPLVVCPDELRTDFEALSALIERERVSIFESTPALINPLVAAVAGAGKRLASLRVLISSADTWHSEDYAAVRAALPPEVRVFNTYGVTEATIDSTFFTESGTPPPDRPTVPIGAPVSGVDAYVLDATGGLRPDGFAGELCIGGIGVARGYLGRPALTAERFVPDGFGGRPGARLYRSGDRARRRGDDTLEFLGRLDQQLKIRGFRIEPGEVEAALTEHPEIAQAAVIGDEPRPGDHRLLAYLVPTRDRRPNSSQLRHHLALRLPDYMHPSGYQFLRQLPLTRNGKLDRAALPRPDQARPRLAAAYTAPATPLEAELAALWTETLAVDHVGANDNFFDLGGHSLLAAKIAYLVRERCKVEVPLRTIFESATVREQAAAIEARRAEAGADDGRPPLTPVGRSAPLPLSVFQQRYVDLERQLEGVAFYFSEVMPVRLRGQLDVDALALAVEALARRHEPLRTVVVPVDGEMRQLPTDELPRLRRIDAGADGAEPDPEDAIQRLIAEDDAQGLRLGATPPVAMTLAAFAPDDHLLMLKTHPALWDGWSGRLFLDELATVYGSVIEGRAPALPPLRIQYADYATWQRRWLETPQARAAVDELVTRLVRDVGLPRWRDEPNAERTFLQARRRFTIPPAVAAGLRDVAARERASPFMALLAILEAVVHRQTGVRTMRACVTIAGRDRFELERVTGPLTNTVILETRLPAGAPFTPVLRKVRAATLGAFATRDVPFEVVVDALRRCERSVDDVCRVGFALFEDELLPFDRGTVLDARIAALAISVPERAIPDEPQKVASPFDLLLEIREGADEGYRGLLHFSLDAVPPDAAAELVDDYVATAAAVVDARSTGGRRAPG